MKQPILFKATDARQNFFKLLNLVEKGREAIIVKKNKGIRFKISLVKEKNINTRKILKKMAKINIKTKSWLEMKKIINKKNKVIL